MTKPMIQLIIITGMSGAGKTVAMQSLEDTNFYCVDNLPPQLIPSFAETMEQSELPVTQISLAVDFRTLDFLNAFPEALETLKKNPGIDYKIVFLEASDQLLVTRYKQTRRRHPMMVKNSLLEGIKTERELLKTLKQQADIVIDTSLLKPAQLQEKMSNLFSTERKGMNLNVMSFGFKYGIPIDADLVFDVRFLPNPHYVEALRPKTGKEEEVAAHVFSTAVAEEYMAKLEEFISFSLPNYEKEGKQQLIIAIGCTGGKHRSVAITEKLGKRFAEGYNTFTNHRDLGRE